MPFHRQPRTRRARSSLVLLVVGVTAVFVTATVIGLPRVGRPGQAGGPVAAGPGLESLSSYAAQRSRPEGVSRKEQPDARWIRVLRRLDHRREEAWRSGQPHRLARVFATGSGVLRADSSALLAYLGRGLRVSGVSLTFARPRVVRQARGTVRLQVVDRLTSVIAHGPDALPVTLPADRPTRHVITLSRTGQGWRIVGVLAV